MRHETREGGTIVRVIHLGQYIGVRDDEEKQSPRDSIDRRNGWDRLQDDR